ncbi:hypothetical protein [Nocardia sp. NPDC057440]|uniref:hypothetical protein n=1 Tax=Nocardia sp. NPDC057440 TaxID=3346134 RepID=UPI00366D07A6
MGSELDAAWRSVRDVLGTAAKDASALDTAWRSVRDVLGAAAKDASAAVAAGPAQAAHGVTETVARAVEADAANAPALVATFSDVSGGIVTTATSSTYVRGRDLIDEVDYRALRRARGTSSLGTSPTFEEIQRLQGFDGPVTIATPHEVAAAVTADRPALFRGFEEDRYVDAFIVGPVRPGGGTTGSGTYASPLEAVALSYTDPTRTQNLSTRQARVVKMALHPDANTITLRALESERSRTQAQVTRELEVERNIANRTGEFTARYFALLDKDLTLADIGQYGALRGWDAIDGSDTWSNREWAVLNPTALMVQR